MADDFGAAVQGAEVMVAGVGLQDLGFLACGGGRKLLRDEGEVEEFGVLAVRDGDGGVVEMSKGGEASGCLERG